MYRAYLFLLLEFSFICINEQTVEQDECVDDMDVIFVFMVNRHGDRTPEKGEIYLSNDPIECDRLTQKYGYGQLTETGKSRSYEFGKSIRSRYGKLLSSEYSPSDIYVECTPVPRTSVTAKIAVTGTYNPEDEWREDMEVVPLVYTVVPFSENRDMPWANCPRHYKHLDRMLKSCPEEMGIFNTLLKELSENLTTDLTKYPVLSYVLYDLCNSQLSLGMPLTDLEISSWDQLTACANLAIDFLYGNSTYFPLQAGNLLTKFFDAADMVISGAEAPRFRLYSEHDFNVYSFQAVCGARPRQGAPKYCSSFALELRKSKLNGKFYVVPVYANVPDDIPMYLEIDGCGPNCEYETFKKQTYKYCLDPEEYKEQCKVQGDGVIDSHPGPKKTLQPSYLLLASARGVTHD